MGMGVGRDPSSSFSDDGRLHGVNNAALAVAMLQQKPRLLSKSMFKVRTVSIEQPRQAYF